MTTSPAPAGADGRPRRPAYWQLIARFDSARTPVVLNTYSRNANRPYTARRRLLPGTGGRAAVAITSHEVIDLADAGSLLGRRGDLGPIWEYLKQR